MGRPAGWMKQLTGRDAMRSPGAPSLRREVERQFWVQIATGITSEKAAEAVGSLAKLLEDSAGTVDTKFGKQYGDYARSAATTVAGLATSLDKKDLDELAASTRDMVKKNPAIAVGAATVLGFVLARLLKGGSSND